jgi:uncharacterized protein (TIGR02001 family)
VPRRALWACVLLASGAAQAQFGASIALESDNRFRGVSLSNDQPGLRLSLSYDHASGVFAGATATRVAFFGDRHAVQLLGYAGVVLRAAAGLNAEFGLTSSTFSGNTRYDYSEVFVGASGERWSLRAYCARDYFGFGQATAYVEFDANTPLHPRLRAFGHVGALTALGAAQTEGGRRTRTDVRIGLGLEVADGIDAQLAWVTASRAGPYTGDDGSRRRSTIVLSLIASF